MKAEELRKRTPLSDLTNILSSSSSSSSSAFNKAVTRCSNNTSTTIDLDLNFSDPNSPCCRTKHTPREKEKNKRKQMLNPHSNLSTIPEQGEGVGDLDLPQGKQSTVLSRKKRRAVSSKQNKSKDAQLQDYIQKQNAYFKEIDEFILSEEEVESLDQLD